MYSAWNLRSDKYPKKILTDALEIYIIEANKAKEFSFKNNKTLDSWLKFINNPKEESQMKNENTDIQTITKFTGLTEEEILKI